MHTLNDVGHLPREHHHDHHLNSAAIHMMWLNEAEKGLVDIAAGCSSDSRTSIVTIQTRRSASRIRNAPRTESRDL